MSKIESDVTKMVEESEYDSDGVQNETKIGHWNRRSRAWGENCGSGETSFSSWQGERKEFFSSFINRKILFFLFVCLFLYNTPSILLYKAEPRRIVSSTMRNRFLLGRESGRRW